MNQDLQNDIYEQSSTSSPYSITSYPKRLKANSKKKKRVWMLMPAYKNKEIIQTSKNSNSFMKYARLIFFLSFPNQPLIYLPFLKACVEYKKTAIPMIIPHARALDECSRDICWVFLIFLRNTKGKLFSSTLLVIYAVLEAT